MLDRWLARLKPVQGAPQPAVSDPERELAEAEALAAAGEIDAALATWSRHAHAGSPRAQRAIAAAFLGGHGVERNPELALKWLTLAAEAGDGHAMRELGDFHFKGEDGFADSAKARRWYTLAAETGDAAAQDMLSWMLAEDGGDPDYAAARVWALKAAAQGVASSMTRLGLLYHNALGVERDPVAAAMWWEKAAYRDDGDGQAMLGAAYHLGSGRPRDPVTALAWLKRAKRHYSHFADRFYEAVWTGCTPEQREVAEQRSQAPLTPAPKPAGPCQ